MEGQGASLLSTPGTAVLKPCSHTPSYLVTGCFLPLCTNKTPLEETGVLSGHRALLPQQQCPDPRVTALFLQVGTVRLVQERDLSKAP